MRSKWNWGLLLACTTLLGCADMHFNQVLSTGTIERAAKGCVDLEWNAWVVSQTHEICDAADASRSMLMTSSCAFHVINAFEMVKEAAFRCQEDGLPVDERCLRDKVENQLK